MKLQSATFMSGREAEKVIADEGITRQLLGFDDSIMMARVEFEKDAVGTQHTHVYAQVTYVESGQFEFTVGSDSRMLEAGDCVYIAPDELHGAVCHEAGVLLDVFSPAREDFLTEK